MELNRTTTAGYLRAGLVASLAFALTACPRPAKPPPQPRPPAPVELEGPVPADAQRFRVYPEQSLVTILVYRAGALASAGHNHVIASREVVGEVVVASSLAQSAFALAMPVVSLTVDEIELRRAAGEDFAADVPQGAREDTRRNLLGGDVLNAARFAYVTLRSRRIAPSPGGATATVDVTVRGDTRTLSVPLRYEHKGRELLVDGEFSVRQTELGLEPFSVLLGALRVADEITVRFRVVARAD